MPLNLSRGSWQHVCVSWSQKGGVWQAYQGGKLRGEGHALATGHHIRPGGVLILGQEQVNEQARIQKNQKVLTGRILKNKQKMVCLSDYCCNR